MKINTDVLIASVEIKENKEKIPYLNIGFISIDDGSMFNIASKEMELMKELEPFKKYKILFDLKDGKYGMSLKLIEVLGIIQ